MTDRRHGDTIREVMTNKNMTEEELLEGCKQILDEKAKTDKKAADKWVSSMNDALTEEIEKSKSPQEKIIDKFFR